MFYGVQYISIGGVVDSTGICKCVVINNTRTVCKQLLYGYLVACSGRKIRKILYQFILQRAFFSFCQLYNAESGELFC